MQYTHLLEQAHLNQHESRIYIFLLEKGPQTAVELAKAVGVQRTHIYYILKSLLAVELIQEYVEGRKTFYRLTHPKHLEEYIAKQQRVLNDVLQEVRFALPGMVSAYNLHYHQPGVSFFEGKQGIITNYEELLEDRLPIDSIEEKGDMLEYFPEYVPKYIQKRIRYKLPNRAIVPSTNVLNTPDLKAYRDAHFIDVKKFPFSMDIKMNSRRVMFTTFKQHGAIGVVIMDPEITKNFRMLFDFLWEVTMPKKS